MKKILLTLFAVAAVFVACDKDGLDQDITNINVVEQANEIDASVEVDALVSSIVDRWTSKDFSSSTTSKGSASTARTSTDPCSEDLRDGLTIGGSTDYISYEVFIHTDGSNYAAVRNEDENGLRAAITPLVTLYFVNLGNGVTAIYTSATGSEVTRFTSVGFGVLYNNAILSLALENLNAGFEYISDGSLSAAGLDCSGTTETQINIRDYYDFTSAPFPLNGVLATKKASAPAALLNYAGTSEASMESTLMTAIMGVQ